MKFRIRLGSIKTSAKNRSGGARGWWQPWISLDGHNPVVKLIHRVGPKGLYFGNQEEAVFPLGKAQEKSAKKEASIKTYQCAMMMVVMTVVVTVATLCAFFVWRFAVY